MHFTHKKFPFKLAKDVGGWRLGTMTINATTSWELLGEFNEFLMLLPSYVHFILESLTDFG